MVALWSDRTLIALMQTHSGPVAQALRGSSGVSAGGNYLCDGRICEWPQELSWQGFFWDPTQWWDDRWSKETLGHPVLRHKDAHHLLWSENWYKPAWVEWHLAMLNAQVDAEKRGPLQLASASRQRASGRLAAHARDLEIEACRKLCEDGQLTEAVDALSMLVQRGCFADTNIFYSFLKSCIAQKDLVLGRRIHALSVECGYEGNEFLATHLIGVYASHGRLEEAMAVFSKVKPPSSHMWASIIFAYARHGKHAEAIGLYQRMRRSNAKVDNRIFVAVLKACAAAADLVVGRDVHAHIRASRLEPDIFVQTCLVNMYAKCGSLEDAQGEFDKLPQKNVVTWNAMIAGYAQHGMGQEALSLYSCMQQEGITSPNSVTFASLLQACASVADLSLGKELHAQIEGQGFQTDVVVGGSLVNMYAKCGSMEDARRVFDRLSQKDVVTWNAMLAGYVRQGIGKEALSLYSSMQQEGVTVPDSVTFACLLQATASVGASHMGKQLHTDLERQGFQTDVVVGASLVNMYAKTGCLEDAQRVFDRLSHKDVVTWNAMIAGYAQQGMGQEALSLYRIMRREGITEPDSVTFLGLLQACASVAALPLGKQLHAQIEEQGLQGDVVLATSLVNMYAKCGSMVDSQQVFDLLPERDIVAWGALIAGYARQGDSETVFDLVDRMKLEGIQPDDVTFLSLLTVCSHAGLVDEGQQYFEAMSSLGIARNIEHYACMVDLLGRAGHLETALHMVKTVPFQPTVAVWLTLLGACRKWGDIEVGRQAFEFAVRLDEKDAAAYVLMANIYAGAQMWEEAKEMQARRVRCGARKEPGRSCWTDMSGVVHSFAVGDKKHPESEGIYARLQRLVPKMKEAGYVPHLGSSLRDTSDHEKEAALCGHSEKLAIAYALNKTPQGTTIHIVKNLRVCEDCHIATTYVSKVENRTIICRDASRFHVFKDGKCSCGDYW